MPASSRSITVLGAGILGLWQALILARAGHRVRLVEASTEPFTDCASLYAAVMLAPDREAENAPAMLRQLGRESVGLWKGFYPQLRANENVKMLQEELAATEKARAERLALATEAVGGAIAVRSARALLGHAEQVLRDAIVNRERTDERFAVGAAGQLEVIDAQAAEQSARNGVLRTRLAYQIESDLLGLLRPHYARVDEEGRTLIQTALQSAAAIAPSKNELAVTLAPLSSNHRSHAISAICAALNKTTTCFPGTNQRMRYGVALVAADPKKRPN